MRNNKSANKIFKLRLFIGIYILCILLAAGLFLPDANKQKPTLVEKPNIETVEAKKATIEPKKISIEDKLLAKEFDLHIIEMHGDYALITGDYDPKKFPIIREKNTMRKRRIDIRIEKRLNLKQLAALSKAILIRDTENLKFHGDTTILYWLPQMELESWNLSWAKTIHHANGGGIGRSIKNTKIEIVGLTIEEEEAIREIPYEGKIIGSWYDETSRMRYTIYEKNKKIFMDTAYPPLSSLFDRKKISDPKRFQKIKASNETQEIEELKFDNGRRFKVPFFIKGKKIFDNIYLIKKNGKLYKIEEIDGAVLYGYIVPAAEESSKKQHETWTPVK